MPVPPKTSRIRREVSWLAWQPAAIFCAHPLPSLSSVFFRRGARLVLLACAPLAAAAAEPTRGPLTIHPANSRWFADRDGRAVYLVGSHTWANFQDFGLAGGKPFDHEAWLAFMEEHRFNFQRLWVWEQAAWAPWSKEKLLVSPMPYRRTGPGLALDGQPKFDLDQFDDAYFDRLRARLIAGRERGIYSAVMLFQGWSYTRPKRSHPGNAWRGHPLNAANNLQGLDGDADRDDVPNLADPVVRARHAAYVRKVVDTVNDLDNVLYEVINEGGTTDWQLFIVRTLQDYQRTKPRQHPVGITGQGAVDVPTALAADTQWVSPGYTDWPGLATEAASTMMRNDPPAWNEAKPSALDTDHLWGHGIDPRWVWKSFLRGHHVLFMDPWNPLPEWNDSLAPHGWHYQRNRFDFPDYVEGRLAMRATVRLAAEFDLARLVPHGGLASSGFCLAEPGRTYIAFRLAGSGELSLDLSAAPGSLRAKWIAAISGQTVWAADVPGGSRRVIACPFNGDGVLVLTTAP